MNQSSPFGNLRFEIPRHSIPQRALVVGAAFVIFTLLWLIVPHGALYWLLMPVILGLIWAASYGWRPAVFTLAQFLHSLLEL